MNLDLRPMSTSQVLDRTFSLYRANFLLFAGIAALPPALGFLGQAGMLAIPFFSSDSTDLSAGSIIGTGVGGLIWLVLYMGGYALATGASVYAVSNAHLGKGITISEAYKAVSDRVFPILFTLALVFIIVFGMVMGGVIVGAAGGAVLGLSGNKGVGLSLVLFPLILGGIVLVVWLSLRLAIAVPACVLEKIGPAASVKRSYALTRGTVGRLFLIFLLYGVIAVALIMAFSIPFFVASALAHGQVGTKWVLLQQFGAFLAGTISTPISIIAISLVYYDQRVRKEAFDLTLMMEAIGQAPPPMAMGTSAGTPNSIG
jgi:Membrane domain of glycerophosphoryl diester phosphodiesterase